MSEKHPIDAVVGELIHRISKSGGSWVLDLADGDEKKVSFEAKLPPLDDYEAPPDWRDHAFQDPFSLVKYAQKYGSADKSVIFWDESQVCVVLEEMPARRREKLTAPWRYSGVFEQWKQYIGRATPYTLLRSELPHLAHTMADAKLVHSLRSIKYHEQTKYDSEIREEEGSAYYGVTFTVEGGGDSIRNIPRKLSISVPVLDFDVIDHSKWVQMEVIVEVQMPKKEKEAMCLILVSPEFEERRRRRLAEVMDQIRGDLGDWLIVGGSHRETKREIGNDDRFKLLDMDID